jgi:hypothetical protein
MDIRPNMFELVEELQEQIATLEAENKELQERIVDLLSIISMEESSENN